MRMVDIATIFYPAVNGIEYNIFLITNTSYYSGKNDERQEKTSKRAIGCISQKLPTQTIRYSEYAANADVFEG